MRTARPTPALVEDIMADCYGNKMPLKHLASISVVLPNQIIIEPWDKSLLQIIDKSVSSALNLSGKVDGVSVRISLPSLSEERRSQLIKILGEKREDARISLRQKRNDILKDLKDLKAKKEIGEDEEFRQRENVQKITDKINDEIDKIYEQKEREIKEV